MLSSSFRSAPRLVITIIMYTVFWKSQRIIFWWGLESGHPE